jgi:hypothetical protein
MKPQFSHSLITSFILWLDNQLCQNGQGYINVTGSLYPSTESSVNGFVYASPYRSWVYDSCVSGANIPSGFYDTGGNFLTRSSGIVIDFINGRVVSPTDLGPYISGTYAKKEINLYFSSDEEVSYVLEQAYGENTNIQYTLTGLQGQVLTAPLIMVTNAKGSNKPWALGGEDQTLNTIRTINIVNSNYLQEAVGSLSKDLAHQNFPLANYSDAPITASGDLKTIPWSYCTGIRDVYGAGNGVYLENVFEVKISEQPNKNKTFYVSTIEFDTSIPRMTH